MNKTRTSDVMQSRETSYFEHFVSRQPRIDRRRRILHPPLRVLSSIPWDIKATGLEHIPASGPTLLMMNHITFIDPIIFTAVVRKRFVISMAKAETLESWFLRGVVRLWGNFVVNRDEVDRMALTNAIDLLKDNRVLLIAPEGTRNPQGMQEPKAGVSYIAHKAQAVIVPAAIGGAQGWEQDLKRLHRKQIRVNFGKPFHFQLPVGERLSREVREAMIHEAMYQLALAMPEEYASNRGIFSNIENATTRYLHFL
ncbi:MAG: 1-acyl-sn-glycerol-3-phosphate acyltransferase [Anaerolineae bacterium]|nr:1-acyl-sn-glycerol-3-phosphate acyltransferase [Anaerolineae bacterium]